MEPTPFPTAPAGRLALDELTALALGADPERTSLPRLYLGLKGRIPRRTFWLHGVLALLLMGLVLNVLLVIANSCGRWWPSRPSASTTSTSRAGGR
jgi:hypothetical protein